MTNHNPQLASALRWIGLTGIAAIAVLRALTAFAPEIYFDVDPAEYLAPLSALSPAGSLVLDVLLLIACALALAGEALSGRSIELKLIALALIPAPIVLWHGWHDLGDLWRGSTWLAAAIALVTVAHLARDRTVRIVLLSALLAVLGPLLLRGFGQITFEHADTVAMFEQNKEQFLRERGWEPGSPSAEIFERRLRQAQPTGWFATTNIYASLMAGSIIAFAGLIMANWRARIRPSSASSIAMIALAVAACAALWFTGSKGAILATFAGLILLIAFTTTLAVSRTRPYAPLILIALIPLTLLAVAFRGAILPETFLGDRSLLFRWHYLVSSFDIFRSAPLAGVGPDGYQAAYTQFRVPRNPEEVISAHSVFIDWVCTLGILAAAWIGIIFTTLWRAGKHIALDDAGDRARTDEAAMHLARNVAAATAVLGVIPAIWFEFEMLADDPLHLFMRLLGVFAFLAVALVTAVGAARLGNRGLSIALAVAAAVLLIHGQIEMTFFQPNFVVWGMCMVGLAGTAMMPSSKSGRAMPLMVPIVVLALTLWIALTGARPAIAQQSRIAEAAAILRTEDMPPPREAAAERLLAAYNILPTNVLPLHAAIRQYELAAAPLYAEARVNMLLRALSVADQAASSHRHPRSLGERAAINAQLAIATGEGRYLDKAVADLTRLTELDPYGIQPWQKLGEVLGLFGRREEAVGAYERALINDANFELDPLKRLPESERTTVRQRIDAVRR